MDLIEGEISNPIAHWYYAHKYNAIRKYLNLESSKSQTIVDIGAGSALFSLALLRENKNLHCLAIDTGYDVAESCDSDNRISYFKDGSGKFGEIYLLTDVLEHVPNDVSVLQFYATTAPTGAKFVITVPAFMSLWSGHDVYLKHYRRYNISQIEKCVIDSGLKVLDSKYLFSSIFLPIWLLRKLPASRKIKTQMREHGRFLNALLLLFLKTELITGRFLPFGISVIVLAEKQ
jgi:hypothetical protein